MLVAQQINELITQHNAPICDACIVQSLKLTTQAHSAQITAALGTTSEFERKNGVCSICKNQRTVIRSTRP